MAKDYEVRLEVFHTAWVTADSEDEAIELAWDQFSDDAGFWDETYEEIIHTEDIEDV